MEHPSYKEFFSVGSQSDERGKLGKKAGENMKSNYQKQILAVEGGCNAAGGLFELENAFYDALREW